MKMKGEDYYVPGTWRRVGLALVASTVVGVAYPPFVLLGAQFLACEMVRRSSGSFALVTFLFPTPFLVFNSVTPQETESV